MAESTWHYLENQFDNSTKRSFKRAHEQGLEHLNKLPRAPEAVSAALRARFDPAWTAYQAKYSEWLNLRGKVKGATQAIEGLFDVLQGDDIESIETDFKVAHKRGTPEHTSAFPLGREPFQRGGVDSRKQALDTLVLRIGELHTALDGVRAQAVTDGAPQAQIDVLERRVESLAAARATATTRAGAIESARAQQDGLQGDLDRGSGALERLRKDLCEALYKNMLALALFYPEEERSEVESFFDLELLQQTGPEEEEPVVVPTPNPPTG